MAAKQFQNVFTIETEKEEIKHLNFSQRRYEGFRGKVEFDKKRIIVSSKNKYSVHSYENYMCDKAFVMLEEELPDHETLVYINFIEDIVPKFLIMIINDTKAMKSRIVLQQIIKTKEYFKEEANHAESLNKLTPVNDVRN